MIVGFSKRAGVDSLLSLLLSLPRKIREEYKCGGRFHGGKYQQQCAKHNLHAEFFFFFFFRGGRTRYEREWRRIFCFLLSLQVSLCPIHHKALSLVELCRIHDSVRARCFRCRFSSPFLIIVFCRLVWVRTTGGVPEAQRRALRRGGSERRHEHPSLPNGEFLRLKAVGGACSRFSSFSRSR